MWVLPVGTKLGETKKTLPRPVVLALVAAENELDPSKMNSTPSTPLDAAGRSVAPTPFT